MKYCKIIIIAILLPTKCFGQVTLYGGFSPGESPYFRAPIGTSVAFTARFSWSDPNWRTDGTDGYPPSPSFHCDSSIEIHVAQIDGSLGSGTDSLYIVIKSDSPRCYGPTGVGIYAHYDSNGVYAGDPYYFLPGVFYDSNVIGKLVFSDSLYCGSVPIDSMAKVRLNIVNDSLAQYRQIKVLSVDEPFSLDDTIEMMYPCEDNYSSNCYFHPTKPGHYVDTAKLLDSLTNDTISVVLIGDAYDAGVSDVPAPQVKLYPNPCDRELQIEAASQEVMQIEIYNLFGECVYSSNTQGADAAIDCSHFPAGVYFVSIDELTSHQTQKLIVAH